MTWAEKKRRGLANVCQKMLQTTSTEEKGEFQPETLARKIGAT